MSVKDIYVDEGVPVHDSARCISDSNQCESEDLVKANQLETKSLEDRNSKLDNSELVMILKQTKMLKYLQDNK